MKDAEACVRFTAEDGCWVDLPVMPLALSRLHHAMLELLQREGPLDARSLLSRLRDHQTHWSLVPELSFESFKELYLTPMWKQGLIAEVSGGYVVGPQWERIQPYEEILRQAREASMSLEELAQQENWVEKELLHFT